MAAEANRVKLSRKRETTWNVVPAGPFDEIRITSETFGEGTTSTSSQEIRSDRQIGDILRTNVTPGGGFNFELSFLSFEPELQGTFGADFSGVETTITGTIGATATGNKFTSDGIGGNSLAGIAAGDWIKTSGFTNAANNGFFRATAASISTEVAVEGAILVTEVAAAARTLKNGDKLRNGTTNISFTYEKQFLDVTPNLAFQNPGMRVDTMALTIEPGAIIKGSFGLPQGGRMVLPGGSGQTLTAVTAAPTKTAMNGVDGVKNIILNRASVVSDSYTQITYNINNNIRARPAIGTLGNAKIPGVGTFTPSGDISLYFQNFSLFSKARDFIATDIAFAVQDQDGNAYLFDLPRVRIFNPVIQAGGINTDVIAKFNWAASMFSSGSLNYTAGISKFTA